MGIKRLEVGGEWIDVKEKLKIGDKANTQSYANEGIAADQKTFKFNTLRYQIANAAVRILNWSLKDGDKPIEYPSGRSFDDRVRTISNLDEEVFEGLTKAIETFEESLSKEKNVPTDGATV